MNTDTKSRDWMSGFIAGLVCGEGNFTIAIAKNDACRLGYHVRPIFQIELSIKDLLLLEVVRDFLGVGCIYFPKPRTRVHNESPTCRYTVSAIGDCCTIAAFFQSNPVLGIKQGAFEVWVECLAIIERGEHTDSSGFSRIVELRQNINQIRRPSTYREQEIITETARQISQRRTLSVWNDTEIALVRSYVTGEIQRSELEKAIHRSPASLSNQITRIRKRLRQAQEGQ
jgi:hypothetical protein